MSDALWVQRTAEKVVEAVRAAIRSDGMTGNVYARWADYARLQARVAEVLAEIVAGGPIPEPRTDAERLARAVLRGEAEAALGLADLVQEQHSRLLGLPAGVTFELAPWRPLARDVFRRRGITTFAQLTGTTAADLDRTPGCGRRTLQHVREVLGRYGLSLSGEKPPRPAGG
jgi:hypothetical protein